MRNGFIMTDVIKNPVTDTPFHSPVVFFHTPFVDETGKLEQAPATIEAPASTEPAAATETQEVSKKVSVKTVGFSSSLGKSNIGEGSVTNDSDYLIVPNLSFGGKKVDNANKYGIKILSLDEFKNNLSMYL